MLAKEQLLLLENLSYTYDRGFPNDYLQSYVGFTIGSYIQSIDLDELVEDHVYCSFMTGKDWIDIFQAFLKDEKLLNLKIITTFIDKYENGGGGFSYLVIDQNTKEAIIVFKGTQGNIEWLDNFQGGGHTQLEDRVSTPCQANALRWFNEIYDAFHLENYEITVIGHSKGGNKAQYITLLTGRVDHCISFDGPGFSDAFIHTYYKQIEKNQNKILNMALENDFINILLNEVGPKEYYEGFNIGNGGGGFKENHCPNSFMKVVDGNVVLNQTNEHRIQGLVMLDDFFNSIFRNFSHESRSIFCEFMGELFVSLDSKNDLDYTIDLLLSHHYKGFTSYTFAYLIEYTQLRSIQKSLLEIVDFVGFKNLEKLVKIVLFFIDSNIGDQLVQFLISLSDKLPDSILSLISNNIYKKTGYQISIYRLMFLIDIIQDVPNYQRMFDELPSGADLKI